jgi:predicted O-methyltransferase YrrM
MTCASFLRRTISTPPSTISTTITLLNSKPLTRSNRVSTMSTNGVAFNASNYHTQNKTWTDVDAYTVSHLHPPSRPNSEALLAALQNSLDQGLPDIASYPVVAKFYALQCRALGVRHALEVGTLGGYTSIFLASENPGLKVTTVEVDPHHRDVALENMKNAGVEDQVEIRLGPGLEVLPKLAKEIAAGKLPKLGFAYIDADKENNWAYMDQIIGMCEPRAVIFVDNMVRGGDLIDPTLKDNKRVKGARQVVEMVGKDDRVDGMVLQTVGEKSYDGMLMAVVK